ncbi:hypothetical protein KDV29_02125, partial [Atlantibacter hermannii]
FGFAENTDDLFVGKTLLHGDVLMWLMKTLLTSGCTNQRGAGHGAYGAGVASAGYNQYQIKQAGQEKPEGKITVEFKGAPPGMTVTDSSSRGIDVNHDVGYTRIGRTGMGG